MPETPTDPTGPTDTRRIPAVDARPYFDGEFDQGNAPEPTAPLPPISGPPSTPAPAAPTGVMSHEDAWDALDLPEGAVDVQVLPDPGTAPFDYLADPPIFDDLKVEMKFDPINDLSPKFDVAGAIRNSYRCLYGKPRDAKGRFVKAGQPDQKADEKGGEK